MKTIILQIYLFFDTSNLVKYLQLHKSFIGHQTKIAFIDFKYINMKHIYTQEIIKNIIF